MGLFSALFGITEPEDTADAHNRGESDAASGRDIGSGYTFMSDAEKKAYSSGYAHTRGQIDYAEGRFNTGYLFDEDYGAGRESARLNEKENED